MIKIQNRNSENFNNVQISTQNSNQDFKNDEKIKKEKIDFLYRENVSLIKIYGPSIYFFSTEIDKKSVNQKIYENHKIEDQVRTKMVDWMIEVLHAYKSDTQTLFLSVNLMDTFIKKTSKTLDNSDIHLIGVTCMYIMSKFEDVIPLRILSVHQKISHKTFSEAQIREQERNILTTLNWDIFFVTCYDFIKTYIFDFLHNNKDVIVKLKMEKVVNNLENIAIYLGKLSLHSEVFVSYENSLKSIACIVAARDLLVSNSETITLECSEFLKNWIIFLINESGYETKSVYEVYTNLVEFYTVKYGEKKNLINFNLKKTHEIKYD